MRARDAARADAGATIVVDALFGAGLDRPVEGVARAMIEAMNAQRRRPCGRSAERHQRHHRRGDGRRSQGRGHGDVLPPQARPSAAAGPPSLRRPSASPISASPPTCSTRIKPQTFANGPQLWGGDFPVPRPDGHKYGRGHAVVVSGGLSSTGAARLAARGALRAGAGLVTIACPRDALASTPRNLAVMVRPVDGADELAEFLARPAHQRGGARPGRRRRARRCETWSSRRSPGERAVVLDADALTSFADEPRRLFAAIRRARRRPRS